MQRGMIFSYILYFRIYKITSFIYLLFKSFENCRFIFLECPKFVGSSSSWDIKNIEETETILNDSIENIITKDNNIIPQEIAEKIVDNILLKKDHFKVNTKCYLILSKSIN